MPTGSYEGVADEGVGSGCSVCGEGERDIFCRRPRASTRVVNPHGLALLTAPGPSHLASCSAFCDITRAFLTGYGFPYGCCTMRFYEYIPFNRIRDFLLGFVSHTYATTRISQQRWNQSHRIN